MKKYRFRLLNVWEKYTEEEKEYLEETAKKDKEKQNKILERIRKTEKDWKVFVEWLGWVKAF
jgi:hypothetical protein